MKEKNKHLLSSYLTLEIMTQYLSTGNIRSFHSLVQSAGQVSDRSQTSDHLFRQKEHAFHSTFLISQLMPIQWRQK